MITLSGLALIDTVPYNYLQRSFEVITHGSAKVTIRSVLPRFDAKTGPLGSRLGSSAGKRLGIPAAGRWRGACRLNRGGVGTKERPAEAASGDPTLQTIQRDTV